MKLVNVVERQRYKKDIVNMVKRIAPELLTSKNFKAAIDKLVHIGLVTQEEKTFFNIKMEAKLVILMIEQLLQDRGINAIGSFCFIDREDRAHGTLGKIVHVSGPHVPEEYIESVDGKFLTPFTGTCGRAVTLNRPMASYNVMEDPNFNGFHHIYEKYNIKTAISFPVHVEGEIVGTLALFACECLEHRPEIKEIVKNKLHDLESVFASIQENWKNRNMLRFKMIVKDGQLWYVEDSIKDVMKYSPEEVIGSDFWSRIHPDDREPLLKVREYVKKHKRAVRQVFRAKNKEGKYIVGEVLFVPITEHDSLRYVEVMVSTNTKACKNYEYLLNTKQKKSCLSN